MTLLILPGTDLYYETLDNSHLFLQLESKQNNAQIQDLNTGLYREANGKEVFEYFYDGEYDEVLELYGN